MYILQTSACADPCVDTRDSCVSRIGQVVQEMLVHVCRGLIWGLRTTGTCGWALLRGTTVSVSASQQIFPHFLRASFSLSWLVHREQITWTPWIFCTFINDKLIYLSPDFNPIVINRLPYLCGHIRDRIYLLLFSRRGIFFFFELEWYTNQLTLITPRGITSCSCVFSGAVRETENKWRAPSVCQLEGFPLHQQHRKNVNWS